MSFGPYKKLKVYQNVVNSKWSAMLKKPHRLYVTLLFVLVALTVYNKLSNRTSQWGPLLAKSNALYSPLMGSQKMVAPINFQASQDFRCRDGEEFGLRVYPSNDRVDILLPSVLESQASVTGGTVSVAAGQPVCVYLRVPDGISPVTNRTFSAPEDSLYPADSLELFASSDHTSYTFSVVPVRTSAKKFRLYRVELVIPDPGDYSLHSFLEYVNYEWNFESPPTIKPGHKLSTCSLAKGRPLTLRVKRPPGDTYLLSKNLEHCKLPNAPGRWKHVSTVSESSASLAPNSRDLVWSPYACSLKQVSHSQFSQCLIRNNASIMWYGDSNSRRAFKSLAGMGAWCSKIQSPVARRLCYCEDQGHEESFWNSSRVDEKVCKHEADLVRDPDTFQSVKPKSIALVKELESSMTGSGVKALDPGTAYPNFTPKVTLYRIGGYTGLYCRKKPTTDDSIVKELVHIKTVQDALLSLNSSRLRDLGRLYTGKNLQDIRNGSLSPSLRKFILSNTAQHDAFLWMADNGGYKPFSVLVLGLVNWDVAFGPISEFKNQTSAFINHLKKALGNSPVPIVLRLGQFANQVYDTTRAHRRVTRLRTEYFNEYTAQEFYKAFGKDRVFVWDVFNLARMLSLSQGRLDPFDCLSSHSDISLIEQENQLLMNLFCYSEQLSDLLQKTNAYHRRYEDIYRTHFQ